MQLALRIWTGTEMIYPVKFSVMYDPKTKQSSVRAFVDNEKFITFDYMMITPFKAINGNIFEKDIVIIDGDENKTGIVEFDLKKGEYVCCTKEECIPLNSMMNIEVAGNIFEDNFLEEETITENIEGTENDVKDTTEETKEENIINNEKLVDNDSLKNEIITEEQTEKVEPIIEEIKEEIVSKEKTSLLSNSSEESCNIKIFFMSAFDDNDKGGYGFTFGLNDLRDTYKGSETNTNAKKIDLSGIISALEMLDGNFKVTIYTTSQYVVYPFIKKWIYKWHDSDWRKNDNSKIQHYELWSTLYNLCEKYNVEWEFVKELNDDMEECKKLAESEI